MLIGLVRDSVMQCFCHTCRAPVLPAAANLRTAPMQRLRTKQPQSSNRVNYITTEIRCQEKSKGGLCYEVILAQPTVVVNPPKANSNAPIAKSVSAEEIERKLREAEERRISLEQKKIADWSAKMSRIEQAGRKKDEMNKDFANQAKEALDAKMGNYEEKREAIMTDLKEKLKNQFQEIEKTRLTLEQQKQQERMAIDNKLKTAAQIRDENIKKMLVRLKEHNTTKLAEVKQIVDARENEKAMEKLHVFENKLFIAEQNREKEIQKKLENIRRHDRHAEEVRQKAAFHKVEQTELEIAASG